MKPLPESVTNSLPECCMDVLSNAEMNSILLNLTEGRESVSKEEVLKVLTDCVEMRISAAIVESIITGEVRVSWDFESDEMVLERGREMS